MKVIKKIFTATIVLMLVLSVSIQVIAASKHWNDNSSKKNIATDWENWKSDWDKAKNNYEQLALTPGKTETELNFAWYSKKADYASIRISKTKDMRKPVIFEGTSSKYKKLSGVTYYSNQVTVTGLIADEVYYYQYNLNGSWSKTNHYVAQKADEFSFLFVGDPQIGASIGQLAGDSTTVLTAELAVRNDAYSWNTTLETAVNANKEIEFILSPGDQVNTIVSDGGKTADLQQESEYVGFLSPKYLTTIPIATSIGNHDYKTANYQNHFNNPNRFIKETTPSTAGNDYYFMYGDVLFIMLNTNNYNCLDHAAFLKKVTKANPDARWRVVTIHQNIYGAGTEHADTDGMLLRTQLTPLMDEYDVDVVLQGHDHTYSRSYQLKSDGENHTAYDSSVNLGDEAVYKKFLKQNLCYDIVSTVEDGKDHLLVNPEGVLYVEAGSSTGSKFYENSTTQKDYIAFSIQTFTPTYSVIDVTKTTFTINTFDVATGKKIDYFMIEKTD